MESQTLDDWRNRFDDSNIFDVIENSILIAASDCPTEFRARRAGIAELLFCCRTARCLGCDRVELQVPEPEDEDAGFRREGEGVMSNGGGEKESKVNSTADDVACLNQMVSNYSYDEAEALTEELEEESQTIREVLRIKGVIDNKSDESDSVLFESLRRLQLMQLSVETLKATEIGKAVNGLRKHNSNQIRHLVRTLIDEWKVLVEEHVAATPILEETTPESMDPSNIDDDFDEGLPSPPLDEGVFLPTETPFEFSKFFEGMDDYGNPQNITEFGRNKGNWRRPTHPNFNKPKRDEPACRSSSPEDKTTRSQDSFVKHKSRQEEVGTKQTKLQEANASHRRVQVSPYRPSKPEAHGNDIGRYPKLSNGQNKSEPKATRPGSAVVRNKPPSIPHDISKNTEDNLVRVKLEMAKRKLQERYQEAENAKKQRTIRVMEIHDLPKQGLNRKPFYPKLGNGNRQWANGRHQ